MINLNTTLTDKFISAIITECKENNIKIINSFHVSEGGKIGREADFQFNIITEVGSSEYKFNYGPALQLERTQTYNEDDVISIAVLNLVTLIKSNNVQFISLVVPKKAVEKAELIEKDNIIVRYIVDYIPQTDSLAERWDILFKKVVKNA